MTNPRDPDATTTPDPILSEDVLTEATIERFTEEINGPRSVTQRN